MFHPRSQGVNSIIIVLSLLIFYEIIIIFNYFIKITYKLYNVKSFACAARRGCKFQDFIYSSIRLGTSWEGARSSLAPLLNRSLKFFLIKNSSEIKFSRDFTKFSLVLIFNEFCSICFDVVKGLFGRFRVEYIFFIYQ